LAFASASLFSVSSIKQLLVIPKGENGKEKPGDLNWVHGMAVAADGTIYFIGDSGKVYAVR